jgi:Pyridoxamine 5'-phosphate oxidase
MSDERTAEPQAGRPSLPQQYGILGPTDGKGLLPWTWATERLERSRGYWLATTRPDHAPHVTVVWGVWLHGRFFFSTIAKSRKASNLAANPRCVVCPERADEAVVVEGVAEEVTDPAVLMRFAQAYAAKYQEEADTSQFVVYGVRPRVAFATVSDAAEYPATATRWRFSNA